MELLTVQETEQLLKVSPITIRRYAASGRLAAVRVGCAVRIRRDAIEALLTPVVPRHLRDDHDEDEVPEGRPLTHNDSLFEITGMFEPGPDLPPGEPTSENDPLWDIVGLFDTGPGGPNDVALDKYKHLADAHDPKRA